MEWLFKDYKETDGYPITIKQKQDLLNELDRLCKNFSLNENQQILYNNYKAMIENAKSLNYVQQEFANGVTKSLLMLALTDIDKDFINFYKIVSLSLELKADELIQNLRKTERII